jgi:hypothetical protein
MPALFFTCPSTNQRGPTGIQADVKSLRKSWSKTVTVNCSLCGRVHKFAVRELYTESILRDATEGWARRPKFCQYPVTPIGRCWSVHFGGGEWRYPSMSRKRSNACVWRGS